VFFLTAIGGKTMPEPIKPLEEQSVGELKKLIRRANEVLDEKRKEAPEKRTLTQAIEDLGNRLGKIEDRLPKEDHSTEGEQGQQRPTHERRTRRREEQ
jgi:hypothetical protein